MVIPAEARKQAGIGQGDVVDVRAEGDGRIVPVRMKRSSRPAPRKAKITYRKGNHAIGSTGRPITSRQVRELLQDLSNIF